MVRRAKKKGRKKKPDLFARQKRDAERERVARENLKKAIQHRAREGDILPDLPLDIPIPGISMIMKALGVPSPIAYMVGAYQAAEMSEKYWGPRLFDYYGAGYPQAPIPGLGLPGLPDMPGVMPKALIPPTRKTSKANKAMKKAYAWLIKGHKGKMTQKKCRELLKKASRMASKANPGTKSRIGKTSRSKMLKECKRIRKQVWGTLKRK